MARFCEGDGLRTNGRRNGGSNVDALAGTATTTALILACGVVTGLIAAQSLGPEGRGQLTIITLWPSTLLYAGTIGVPEAVAYFSAADRERRVTAWWTGQALAVILGACVMAAGWVLVPLLVSGSDAALLPSVRTYLAWFSIPALCSLTACAWLQGVGASRQFNGSRLLVHVVNAAGTAALFAFGSRQVWPFAAVLLAGNAATWLVASGLGPLARGQFAAPSGRMAGSMLHYGARVQFGSWSNAANVRLDQLLLSIFAPAASLGLYVVAVSFAGLLLTLPTSAALVMLPEIVRTHRAGNERRCLTLWYRRVLWATIAAAIGLGLASRLVVPFVFGAGFGAAVPVIALLIPATVLLGMNQLLAAGFRGIGRPEIASQAEVVGLAVTIPGLALLLPAYGIYGAAVASLAAYAASHVYLLRQANRVFGSDFKRLFLPRKRDLTGIWIASVRRFRATTHAPIRRVVKTQEL